MKTSCILLTIDDRRPDPISSIPSIFTPNVISTMRFTEELRDAAGDQWDRIINHKFTKDLAVGTIDRECLKKCKLTESICVDDVENNNRVLKYFLFLYQYHTTDLIQDHRFLDSFVVLFASIVAKARSLEDRIPGCQFLALIVGKENTYFERSFEALGVTMEERQNIPDAPCTAAFCNLMREVASTGSLAEMLAVVVVCEWSYLSWGELVLDSTVREDFFCYEWVDLHSGDYFTSVINYLRGLLDKELEYLNESEKAACKNRFLQTVQLEEDFFDLAMK
jgi:thiaminase/transcriptional activator TenA